MTKVKIEILAEIYDASGNLKERQPWREANSLLKAFIQALSCQLAVANQTIKDTGGTDRDCPVNTGNLRTAAPAATTTYGIVVGTGETAVTMADNKLETQVFTNIAHALPSYLVENPDSSTWRIAITRAFTNNTGATVNIKEVGLYCMVGGTTWFACIDRTLYSVSIPNGEILALTYRITVSL